MTGAAPQPAAGFEPGRPGWRRARAARLAWLVNAGPYFRMLDAALGRARQQVIFVGWDLDSRVALVREDGAPGLGTPLCDLLLQRLDAQPELHVYLLNWDYSALFALEREWVSEFRLPWYHHDRLRYVTDNHHAPGASHHEKIVVVDDRIAFCGGIDVTRARWDVWQHPVDEQRRRTPAGTPYGPFHDVQLAIDGDAARALGELVRGRWENATGEVLPVPTAATDPWPDTLEARLADVDVIIARTRAPWRDMPAIDEALQLYLDTIGAARDYLFIANQYLTATRICDALIERLGDPDGPEVIIVVPHEGHGWLEERTMIALREASIARLAEGDRHGRLRIVAPVDTRPDARNLNVHAKLMVADDRWVRVGSCNLTNRSMTLDTECDLVVDCPEPRVARRFVAEVIADQVGREPDAVAAAWDRNGRLSAVVDGLGEGERCYARLKAGPDAERGAILARLSDLEGPYTVPESRAGGPASGVPPWMPFVLLGLALVGVAAVWRFGLLPEGLGPALLPSIRAGLEAGPGPWLMVPLAYAIASLLVFPVVLLITATLLLYGPWTGFALSMCGIAVSAALTFAVGSAIGGRALRRLPQSAIHRISRQLSRQGILALASIRLVPIAPYTVVNLVAGASHIGFRDYFVGTLLGMAPGTAALALVVQGATATLGNGIGIQVGALLLALGLTGLVVTGVRAWRRLRAER